MSTISLRQIILDFARQHKTELIWYGILSLASPIAEVLLPYFYGKIIDRLAVSTEWSQIRKYVLYTIIVWITVQVLYSLLDQLDISFIPALEKHIRHEIVHKVAESVKEDIHEVDVGEILTTMVKLPFTCKDLFHQIRHFFAPTVLILIGQLIYLFFINIRLGFISLFCLGIFFFVLYRFAKVCTGPSRRSDQLYGKLADEIDDILNNLISIHSSSMLEQELGTFDQSQDEVVDQELKTIGCASYYKRLFGISYVLMFLFVNGYAYYLVRQKVIGLDKFTTILIINLYLLSNLGEVASEIRNLLYNIGTISAAESYFNSLMTPTVSGSDIEKNSISVKGLNVDDILQNINLEIPENGVVVLTGTIGSGKSTLINTLMKYRSYTGSIQYGSTELRDIGTNQLRKRIAFIQQQPKLFNRSLGENILYGTGKSREDAERLMHALELESVFRSTSWEEVVGRNGERLSGGQKQIVLLLRALLRDVPILFLDEPTASLHGEMKDHIVKILQYLKGHKTMVIISHDQQLLRLGKVVRLEHGRQVR